MDQYADEVCVRPCATPLSARWLASHWDVGGGKLPYHLRGSVTASGLKPLDVERHWLELDSNIGRLGDQLRLKRAILTKGSPHFDACVAVDGDYTLGAQGEVLRLVLECLISGQRRCPTRVRHHRFHFEGGRRPRDAAEAAASLDRVGAKDARDAAALVVGVQVIAAGDEWLDLDDWSDDPLALACALVQEDFILLKRVDDDFAFVAGAACFAFSAVPQTTGASLVLECPCFAINGVKKRIRRARP